MQIDESDEHEANGLHSIFERREPGSNTTVERELRIAKQPSPVRGVSETSETFIGVWHYVSFCKRPFDQPRVDSSDILKIDR
jgi:hypothetical protein